MAPRSLRDINVVKNEVNKDLEKLTNEEEMDCNEFLASKDVVFVVDFQDTVKIYPQKILVWHEIVNEDIEGEKISISYCPLTGSAIGYKGYIESIDKETTYGVSGKLLNSNLVMYDRATDSYIPQVLGVGINGELTGEKLDTFPVIWTIWDLAKEKYPQALVLTEDTGYFRNYNRDPYGSYLEEENYYDSGSTLFPLMNTDGRLGEKEVVIGVRGQEEPLAIKKDFLRTEKVYNDESVGIVAFYDESLDTVRVFSSSFNSENLRFNFEDGVIYDNNGIVWSAEGVSSEGSLKWVDSFEVMWFSWSSFFPETKLAS